MFELSKGLEIGNRILNRLKKVDFLKGEDYYIEIDTFNNCRETGYCLWITTNEYKKDLYVWIHEHRNSDDIVVRWTNNMEDKNVNNMFNDKVHENQTKLFKWKRYDEATNYIIELINSTFETEKGKKNN